MRGGFFRPLYRVSVPQASARGLISAMVSRDVPFSDIERCGDEIIFHIRRRDRAAVFDMAKRLNVPAKCELSGFFALMKKYRRRAGLPIGALIAAAMVLISSKFVWDIRYPEGTPAEVEAALAQRGFTLGAYLPGLDLTGICQSVTSESEDISWLSINMHGTVAHIEYRMRLEGEREDISEPSNLVASCDGQIVRIEAVGGKSVVRIGQTVKAGDVLLSGVIDSEALGYRLVRSRGEVFAAVSKTFTACCPLDITEKMPTGRTKTVKNIKFFSNFSENEKNIDTTFKKYDTIEKTERLTVFDVRLPVYVRQTTLIEYEDDDVMLSESDAEARATEDALLQIEKTCGKNDVTSTSKKVEKSDGKIYVSITVEYVTNIATEQKIKTEQK